MGYELVTLTNDTLPVRSESGLRTLADDNVANCMELHTLVIVGGRGCQSVINNEQQMTTAGWRQRCTDLVF
ncbi:hypothetical protein N482_11170 [Pseudoalteromonas luteoviolacea NCIMB 1942]|uniref:DJ-1/PfpI domain-containing protein n=1 Tax=Pseudoalteromonas luteoviolacea NCIMB 1942 TaxID=1365253 RepID=A0A167BW43_9GAMM|nr:hypothetical protein N482_11170 [Pseudoalteromonas luteoviolacea NCIMB 1942]